MKRPPRSKPLDLLRWRRDRWIIGAFHRLAFRRGAGRAGRWMGTALIKNPLDLWIYQELVHRLRPDIIVETGTLHGGSALYLAHLLDILGHGRVVTVDIEDRPGRPVHPRITYVTGSSVAPEVLDRVRAEVAGAETVLVILDSDHTRRHVLAELRAYAPLVTPGSYVIVEDTQFNHPVRGLDDPGPWAAVTAFLRENRAFAIDRRCERYLYTWNPRGYLRRRTVKDA